MSQQPNSAPEETVSPSGIPIDWGKHDDIQKALFGENGDGEINTRWLLTDVRKSLALENGTGTTAVSLPKTLENLGIVRHTIVTDRNPRHVQTLRQSGVRYILARHQTGSINFYDIDGNTRAFDDHIYRQSFGGSYVLLYNKEEATGIGKIILNIRSFLSGALDSE